MQIESALALPCQIRSTLLGTLEIFPGHPGDPGKITTMAGTAPVGD